MKVLYVAHYRENSGWGDAARNYILAMDKVGIDVACRPIIYQNNAKLPDRILELERKSYSKYDFCIQNVLPHHFEWSSAFKACIGQFVVESYGLKHTSWHQRINMMDAIFFPCLPSSMLDISELTPRTFIIPHAFDTEELLRDREPLDIPELKGKFVFYFIGEFNRRKNVGALLRAFHTTFSNNEDVALVLKVNKPGVSPNELGSTVNKFCNEIKSSLGLYNNLNDYHNEVIIPMHVPREDLLRLHKTGDCFITTSFGEACCIPAHEALIMGNKLVVPNYGPFEMLPFYGDVRTFQVSLQPMVAAEKTFPGFGTAREKWWVPNVGDVGDCMRDSYNLSREKRQPKCSSYESVGKNILHALEELS